MKTLLLQFLSLCLVSRATTIVFRYGINPEIPAGAEDMSGAVLVAEGATVRSIVFSDVNGYVYQTVEKPLDGFQMTFPDGQEGSVWVVLADGSTHGMQPFPASGRWCYWSVPSGFSAYRLAPDERADASSRITLGLCSIGLGAVFFRAYKTGRSGT
jgi:hypothetical protein